MSKKTDLEERKEGKELYAYQKGAINQIFKLFEEAPEDYHLLYQLPTGGGKTVIFSEIVRQYIAKHDKKVVVLTHRIELCKQTSKMLKGFDVKNKIINSNIKELPDQNDYSCFVAMVETLKNRINDEKLHLDNIGLVGIGLICMTIHALLLILVAKLIRAPYFFLAVGSQANVGGAASAPIVASAFHPSLATVGVLLAVFGYAIGTVAAIGCTILLELAASV